MRGRGDERRPPVHGIVDLSVHDHGFKHWAFTHHKLDHSVDEREQIPTREAQLKQTDSDWPHASPLQQQSLAVASIHALSNPLSKD